MELHALIKHPVRALRLFGLILLPFSTPAQHTVDKDYLVNIEQWGPEDGLPTWKIYRLFEDSRGLIWLGSDNCIIRFDGVNFRKYDFDDLNVHLGQVLNFAEDVDGRIWIFSLEGACLNIHILDPFTEIVQSFEKLIGKLPEMGTEQFMEVQCIKRKIWIVDRHKNGYLYDGAWKQVFTPQLGNWTNSRIYPLQANQFMAVDENNRFCRLDSKGKVIDCQDFNFSGMVSIFEDGNFNLWCVSPKFQSNTDIPDALTFMLANHMGFRHIEASGLAGISRAGNFSSLNHGNVYLNNRGELLYHSLNDIVLYHKGRSILDNVGEKMKNEYHTLPAEFCTTSDGSIWGFSSEGIFRFSVQKRMFSLLLQNRTLPFSCRGIVAADNNSIIVNTYSGTQKVNLSDGTYRELAYSKNDWGLAVAKNDDKYLIGTHGDIVAIDGRGKEIKYPLPKGITETEVYSIKVLDNGTILAGATKGLFIWNKNTASFEAVPQVNDPVYTIIQSKSGIWFGQKGSIGHINENLTVAQKIPVKEGVAVAHIHEDDAGALWLATDHGLIEMDKNRNIVKWYTSTNKLPEERIHAVYEDKRQRLWMSSDNGLIVFDKRRRLFKSYFTDSGLPSNEFNSISHYQAADGRLFFGGLNGVVAFYPDSIDWHAVGIARIGIADVYATKRKTGEMVGITKQWLTENKICFDSRFNLLKINLVFRQGSSSQDKSLLWRLKGVYDDWRFVSGNELEIPKVPYGTYELEVRPAEMFSDSDQSPETLLVPIEIVRPFYLQWWFFVVYWLAVIAGFALFFYFDKLRLVRRNRMLEEKLAERTRKILQDKQQLEHMTEDLRRIDDVKTRFFVNINHELKTPLSYVAGTLEQLQEERQLSAEGKRRLARLERSVKGIGSMVEDILHLSNLNNSKLTWTAHPVLLKPLAERLLAAFETLAEFRSINCSLDFGLPENTAVMLDIVKTERIINNLLANALKYSPPGSRVKLFIKETEGSLHIAVSDTGTGIHKEDLPNIFNRYYQARNANFAAESGFGIGLSIVQEYAHLAGGTVNVSSEYGKGSVFNVFLPLFVANEEVPLVEAKPTRTISTEGNWHLHNPDAEQTLLIVEDNSDYMDYLFSILGQYYRLIGAGNGQAALEKLNHHKIDGIISDYKMPGMDGMELLSKIRKNPEWQQLPFILLTAFPDDSLKVEALRIGVDDYIAKPFQSVELLARVENLQNNYKRRKGLLDQVIMKTHPDQADFDDGKSISVKTHWLKTLESHVMTNLKDERFDIQTLAHLMLVSERTLRTKIRAYTGLGPNEYLTEARLHRAKVLLENRAFTTVAEVSYQVGIKSPAYFSKIYFKRFGKAPSSYFH